MKKHNSNPYQKILAEMKTILNDCNWNGKVIDKNYKKHPDDIKYQSLLNRSIKLIENTLGINNSQYKKLIDFTNHDAASTRGWFLADIYETLLQAYHIFKDIRDSTDMDMTTPIEEKKLEYDAFLSYATEDIGIAEKIYRKLTKKGKIIWFYKKNVKPGDTVVLNIDKGIRKSKYGILLLSKNYFNKNWPKKEFSALLKKSTDSGEDIIIPLYYGVDNAFVSNKSSFLSDIDSILIDGNLEDVIERIIDRLEGKEKSFLKISESNNNKEILKILTKDSIEVLPQIKPGGRNSKNNPINITIKNLSHNPIDITKIVIKTEFPLKNIKHKSYLCLGEHEYFYDKDGNLEAPFFSSPINVGGGSYLLIKMFMWTVSNINYQDSHKFNFSVHFNIKDTSQIVEYELSIEIVRKDRLM